ncbi:MAG: hypothetical protein E7253_00865 [Lachnospiraceae bacterium]|nr:hypothetical protein [Lachnospiraceae bacterium]
MENILLNSTDYANLAKRYSFDRSEWNQEKIQCLITLKNAIETFSKEHGYCIEISEGKEPCININPDSQRGRIRGRAAGVYVIPTKGLTKLVLHENTYVRLSNKYELPECKLKNNQYHCSLNFCDLCSFIKAIITL